MSENQTNKSEEQATGLIGRFQSIPRPLRIVIFLLIFFGVFMLLFSGVAAIYYGNVRAIPRIEPISLQDERVTVSEFAVFADDANDVYPSALATAPDGTLYIGSYLTGTLYAVDSNGTITEVPQSRDSIGSISGLDWHAGILYILDRIDPVSGSGGIVWAYDGETLTQQLILSAEGRNPITAPNDITADNESNLYITDLSSDTVWRFNPDGERTAWWLSTGDNTAPAGLAHNAFTDSILITDIGQNNVYSIPVGADDTRAEMQTLYRHDPESGVRLGLNGIDATSDGRIYVAALDDNRVVALDPETGTIASLAGGYRGSVDVAYDSLTNRIFVANWDQRWLSPVTFIIFSTQIDARLPFSVDAIEFVQD